MAIQYPAFYKTKLEGSKRDQFTVELDSEGRAWLEELKEDWDFKSDSKALKLALEIAINQKKSFFSRKTWQYILRSDRQRLSQYKKLPEPVLEENAMPEIKNSNAF